MVQHMREYPPIEDYGLIGDCHTAALVSSRGSIDWLCLPRFDSPSIFGRILDIEQGGFWQIAPTARHQSRHRYIENTNILETIFTTNNGRVRLLDFMPIQTVDDPSVRQAPRSIIRVLEAVDGEVECLSTCAPRPNYARDDPKISIDNRQAHFGECVLSGPEPWELDQANQAVHGRVTLRAGERVAFTLRRVLPEEQPTEPASDPFDDLDATETYWRDWVNHCTYQGQYREMVVRSTLALRLLVYNPTGAIVAAPTTSLPEEIGGERNWDYRFTWIRDASFTLYALLLAGFIDEDDAFFNWIKSRVELAETGIKILYPVTRDGQVIEQELSHLSGYRGSRPVRIGNAAVDQLQLDVYGEVFDALHFACKTGGFDVTHVWDRFRPLADWVAENWSLPGSGVWEVRGGTRHFVYAKAMAWVALDRAIKLVKEYQLDGDIDRWRSERRRIRKDVFAKGWSDRLQAFKQSYEDERLDAANLRLSLVGFIDGDDPRMVSTIDATLDRLVVDGLCYRYLDAPEGLTGNEGTFVLCSFWLIDALIMAGRTDQAQEIFEQMLSRASSLGLYAEEIHHATGAHLGNFPQAFSHIGLISAAVSLAHAGQAGSVPLERAEAAERAGSGGGGQSRKKYTRHKDEDE